MVAASEAVVVCGRAFSASELEVIRGIIGSVPQLNRRQIATRTCELLDWRSRNGRLKEMSCRVALLRLARAGLIELPPPLRASPNGKAYRPTVTLGPSLFEVPSDLDALGEVRLSAVRGSAASRLWNEAISRFHYLGYERLPGAQMRYLIEFSGGLLGVLGFGASAWKLAPRDQWIGWSHEQRKSRLHLVVNNARFLLLPWVRVHNLASWVLARCARRLPAEWEARYGYRPVLLETFVDAARFRGTCYEAANWRYLGDTKGRGKLDREHRCAVPVKKIYVQPLTANFREVLCS
jgi:hypothetical protein